MAITSAYEATKPASNPASRAVLFIALQKITMELTEQGPCPKNQTVCRQSKEDEDELSDDRKC